jgi:hypothetical protein
MKPKPRTFFLKFRKKLNTFFETNLEQKTPNQIPSLKMSTVQAIRIVSLPSELQTTYDVATFCENVLHINEVAGVSILPLQTNLGVRYRSAIVDIAKWEETNSYLQTLGVPDNTGVQISEKDLPMSIHFDNGKPMPHLKVIVATPQNPATTPLDLSQGDWTSIYMPVLPADLAMDNGDVKYNDEASLSAFFEDELKIGQVSRVDFVTRIIPGQETTVRSAYVHFDHWYDNNITKTVRKTIQARGEFVCHGYYNGFDFCKFDRSRFITFKVNYKPIPTADASLNIHQLAAAKEALEKRVAELEARNAELENRIQAKDQPMTLSELDTTTVEV